MKTRLLAAALLFSFVASAKNAPPLASIRIFPAPVVVTAEPVSRKQIPNQQLPSDVIPTQAIRVSPTPRFASSQAATPNDAASALASRCAVSKRPLHCMDLQIENAEVRIDSAEVRLFNCGEIRKFDSSLDKKTVDSLILGYRTQLRFKGTQAFNAELTNAGRVSKFKIKEIELRATMSHLEALSALDSKVCSASGFSQLYTDAIGLK